MSDTTRFLALHALKVKGLASADDLAVITGVEDLGPTLEGLVGEELVRLRTGRVGGYALTKDGRAAHAEALPDSVSVAERAALDEAYRTFLPVNSRFKATCTRWQCVDGGERLNDHSDADYDARVIEDLATTHEEISAALAAVEDVSPRFGRYVPRFAAALTRVRAGENEAFARPMSNSYHDVWMELHEDLLLTLGRERDAADGH
ncbi:MULTISPECIES: hypothetical protein [Pseudonocardia]|uniref:Uncharacterized protein n=2 Tax=Pseudonocardia TaxID=1847 RepID=A0A1Y2MPD2_PSEAH|nr:MULTISPECIES: hypothetical protein [Pseudonocardia]OSY37100.1 hypothetical protein BG845_04983 [Pseudonocardia autotrophica]TDN72072.1 DNA-binding IscR family transcriptional regulator [Pseudonocardia autotrophica]BBG02770.1 hypothetical protein Pdca_39790 [Pseudonocardia autotrophica]GEC25897.1 hypothetical protein PSA01_29260 [Pseudonocardia saturnea]